MNAEEAKALRKQAVITPTMEAIYEAIRKEATKGGYYVILEHFTDGIKNRSEMVKQIETKLKENGYEVFQDTGSMGRGDGDGTIVKW